MIKKTFIFFVLLIFLVSTASAATLSVGSKAKYHTIQSAVNAAKDGDTINVAAGTYKENVVVDNKHLKIIGQKGKYPTVYGFKNNEQDQGFDINGFKITKYGVSYVFNTASALVRNNYFMNCNLYIGGQVGDFTIMNNQFIGPKAGISGYDTSYLSITGNKFTKCNIGFEGSLMWTPIVSKNIFTQCGTAVKLYDVPLSGFNGNKYIKNTKNIVVV